MEQKVSCIVFIYHLICLSVLSSDLMFVLIFFVCLNEIEFIFSVMGVSRFSIFFFHSWDEWVPESRVLKYVDSNLAKQKELQKANQ